MAGKGDDTEVSASAAGSTPLSPSASRSERMNRESEVCWRKEVDTNLKRLHSLLFGADIALQKDDFTSAHVLGLRLIGFLDSHCHNDVDEAFIRPIRRDASSKICTARQSLFRESNRQAFEQAGSEQGCVFGKNTNLDFEKMRQSKYFQDLCQQAKGISNELGDNLDRGDKLDCKTSKVPRQAKLTSLCGNNTSKENNSLSSKSLLNSRSDRSEEYTFMERTHSHHNLTKGLGVSTFLNAEDEERAHGINSGAKRPYVGICSPRSENSKSLISNEEANIEVSGNGFVTARAKLEMDSRQRAGQLGSPSASVSPQSDSNATNKVYGARSYGISRRGIRGNFVPPIRSNGGNAGNMISRIGGKGEDALDDSTKRCLEVLCGPDGELPEKLRNLEPRLIEHVSNEIMDRDPNVRWDDIAGLEHAKKCVTEMVIWPLLRPDIFKGCRSPGRGLLLFGPPGTGKTMIGKAIAGEAKATFFYISASSLTSKWIGEGEKLVRALFGVASCRQPAVIFVDEIDSLLSQRKSEGEHESSRRLKTQFLIEMEGFDSVNEQILLIGATNRPQELDEAARRRLTKRLYIPLPSSDARAWIIRNLLEKDGLFKLSMEDTDTICKLTEGYSGSDMKNLVKDASMGPLREALRQGIEITKLKKEDMRPVTLQDFENALQEVRPSVSSNELGIYEEWNKQFGSLSL
ncbi:ATPase family AAA domain-containing protein FIGL1 [Diospyros lotus]|uniref:ATPase family AAA domain-containing protein FIGL1 n=1 Tax=Diospyros lotus TaxID=55363 RepID=UPI0022551585|nr:ATPase family AAA domain-containing protein FIGL1 [Diospyros lotus]